MTDNEIISLIKQHIDPTYLLGSSLILKENIGTYNSVLIESPTTRYRSVTNGNKSILFCRIKNDKGFRYISFSDKYEKDFKSTGFNVKNIKSDNGFIRIGIDEFVENISNAKTILNKVFREAFSFPAFGCCSKYMECSAAEQCLHEDQLYATACMYRKNLENGNNFLKEIAKETEPNIVNPLENQKNDIQYKFITPSKEWTRFSNDDEKIEFLKTVKLLPKTATEMRKFYYNGLFISSLTECNIVGYVDSTVLVIEISNQLHCIAADPPVLPILR